MKGALKLRIWAKSRWLRGILLLLAILLLPYGFSRIASPWRCVSLHSLPGAGRDAGPRSVGGIRIACYNIAHGRGVAASNWDGGDQAERRARLDQIAGLLRRIDADVVVLNEVDFDCCLSYSTNQARYLAEKAGYPYWVEQRNLDLRVLGWTWRSGNAVLSRYPITGAQVVRLPAYSDWETVLAGKKRSVVCDIRLGDDSIRVIGAHLSHRSEAVRVRSAEIFSKIAAESDVPTFVVGDLNSSPPGFPHSTSDPGGDNAIEVFDNSGRFRRSPERLPVEAHAMTFHSVDPGWVIDWILVPRDWNFLHYMVESSELSDHRPVYADAAPGSGSSRPAAAPPL